LDEGPSIKKEIELLAKTFPTEEKFKLTGQIIRSVRSINSNIAEGHGRFTYKDQVHFCIQARGSLSETLNRLIDAFDSTYINADELQRYKAKVDDGGKLLNGYITYLRKNI
jgi:four helix bundle protein